MHDCQTRKMALKLGRCFWQCSLKPIQTLALPQRFIVIPPNSGEPTKTNQEVIKALTQAVIGGMCSIIA